MYFTTLKFLPASSVCKHVVCERLLLQGGMLRWVSLGELSCLKNERFQWYSRTLLFTSIWQDFRFPKVLCWLSRTNRDASQFTKHHFTCLRRSSQTFPNCFESSNLNAKFCPDCYFHFMVKKLKIWKIFDWPRSRIFASILKSSCLIPKPSIMLQNPNIFMLKAAERYRMTRLTQTAIRSHTT